MLLVRASAGPSRIHGIGLIAREAIPKGTIVWRFMPGFDQKIPERRISWLSLESRRQLIYYAYFDLETRRFVLSGDDDRFTNHCLTPNTEVVTDETVATRDINVGDEITIDYTDLVVLHFPVASTYGVDLGDVG